MSSRVNGVIWIGLGIVQFVLYGLYIGDAELRRYTAVGYRKGMFFSLFPVWVLIGSGIAKIFRGNGFDKNGKSNLIILMLGMIFFDLIMLLIKEHELGRW